MWKALVYKEIRELLPVSCIVLIVYLGLIGQMASFPVLAFISGQIRENTGIPFLDEQLFGPFIAVSVGFTLALAYLQTVKESNRGTWLFLLHRPVNRKHIVAIKLVVGTGLYLVGSAIVLLLYTAWAATPGTHASPFAWWMTVPVWKIWLTMPLCYLGAFLAGIRPGRWFGTRLMPLVVVGTLTGGIGAIYQRWSILGLTAIVVMSAILVGLILYVAQTRDFS
jgi:hypothetical protein